MSGFQQPVPRQALPLQGIKTFQQSLQRPLFGAENNPAPEPESFDPLTIQPFLSKDAKAIFEDMIHASLRFQLYGVVGSEHLLLALADPPHQRSKAVKAFIEQAGLTAPEIENILRNPHRNVSRIRPLEELEFTPPVQEIWLSALDLAKARNARKPIIQPQDIVKALQQYNNPAEFQRVLEIITRHRKAPHSKTGQGFNQSA
jgi:hypothetical protein